MIDEIEIANPPSGYAREKRYVLIAVAVLAVAPAPLIALLGKGMEPGINLISTLGFNISIFAWCYYDALERDQSLGRGFRFLLILFGGLALFVYLFRSRGFRRGLGASGFALLAVAGTVLLTLISGIITLFALDQNKWAG